MNLYRYVGNNPVTFVDPTGLSIALPTQRFSSPIASSVFGGLPISTFGSTTTTGFTGGNGLLRFSGGNRSTSGFSNDGVAPPGFNSSFDATPIDTPPIWSMNFSSGNPLASELSFDAYNFGQLPPARPDTPRTVESVRQIGGKPLGDYYRQPAADLTSFVQSTESPLAAGAAQFVLPVVRILGNNMGGTIDFLLPPSVPSQEIIYADGGRLLNFSQGPANDADYARGLLVVGAFRGGAATPTARLSAKIQRQMAARGWTQTQIDEAIRGGQQVPAFNKATGNPATRYVHPTTGQSVVVDNVTNEAIHVGRPGYQYGTGSGDLPLLPPPGN